MAPAPGALPTILHAAGDAPLTVATDFNPLLLMVAREMFAGRSLELYEFPIAPRGVEDHAILRKLESPGAARAGLELVAADALQAPFADGVFDTVITHWFIDIVGESFARVAARINLALRPGGRWINSGSLAFSRAAHAERIGLDEALEAMPQAGFGEVKVRETTLPYMRSPASRHSRLENVVTWVTNKVAAPAEAPRLARVAGVAGAGRPPGAADARLRNAGDFQPYSRLHAGADQRRTFHARHGAHAGRTAPHDCRRGRGAGAHLPDPPARRQREGQAVPGRHSGINIRDLLAEFCA
jgi:hypothetical protein